MTAAELFALFIPPWIPCIIKPARAEGNTMFENTMFDDVTFKIINVDDNRINRLNDRFARYLLASGRGKPFLMAFINSVLLLEGDDKIVDLELIPGELHGPDAKTKLSILDVSAKLMDGRTVDVEIQIVNRHDFRKRGPFYLAKRHALKLEAGSKTTYAEIKPTIAICLLAFNLLEEEEEYRNSYSLRNDKSGKRLCDDMQIIYLELPKFLGLLGTEHPRTGLERWLLYFCNEAGERMDKVMAEDSVLSMARDVELSFWADEKERELYFQYQKYLMDAYSEEHTYEVLLKQERERAEREKEKAAQDGLKQGQIKIARTMLARNMPVGDLIDLTGLDEKQILALRQS
jgi:predicted transposase/invertase (TIGR01784 family)